MRWCEHVWLCMCGSVCVVLIIIIRPRCSPFCNVNNNNNNNNNADRNASGESHELRRGERNNASDNYQSAIAKHLAENDGCRSKYEDSCFHI